MNRLPLVAVLCLGMGCKPAASDIDQPGGGLVVERSTPMTDADGILSLEIQLQEGDRSFEVTGFGDPYMTLEALYDPNGELVLWWEDWWSSDEKLTNSFYPRGPMAFNWPIRDVDGALEPGVWTVELGNIDGDLNYIRAENEVEVFVHVREDSDDEGSRVDVQVVYAGGIGADPDVVEAVESAVDGWEDIWAGVGIDLRVTYGDIALGGIVPEPNGGDDAYEAAADANGDDVLTLVVGELIGDTTLYGQSGNIPGTVAAGPTSVVAVSWLEHAGTNAVFDDDEVRVLSETMAHEVGHYLGLFHPVNGDYDQWDALEDTTRCSAEAFCEQELGSNNMFPFPLWTGTEYQLQDDLTADQVAVMLRHVAAQ